LDFRWVAWNTEHIAAHGVGPGEVEELVETARSPFPRRIEDDKWLVWGSTSGGRLLQVCSCSTMVERCSSSMPAT
jgi:hypothetical protein